MLTLKGREKQAELEEVTGPVPEDDEEDEKKAEME